MLISTTLVPVVAVDAVVLAAAPSLPSPDDPQPMASSRAVPTRRANLAAWRVTGG
jgi:hypothetical protein